MHFKSAMLSSHKNLPATEHDHLPSEQGGKCAEDTQTVTGSQGWG